MKLQLKNMAFGVLSSLAVNCTASDLDEWLSEDSFSQNMLELKAGADNDTSNFYGVRAKFALPAYGSLELAYSYWQSDLEDNDGLVQFEESDKEHAFQFLATSDEWHDWFFSLGYDRIERDNVLDIDELSLELNYSPGQWRFTGLFYGGDIDAYLLADVGQRRVSRSANIARQGFGAQLSYDFSNWYWRLRYVDFQYDRDFGERPAAQNLRQRVLSNLQFNRGTYLSDWQVVSDIQWNVNKASLLIGVTQSESVVATEGITQLYTGVDYQLTNDFSLGVFAGALPDDDLLYGELSLAYYW